MTQRISWVDALKGFAILTVVIGHCATDAMSSNTYPLYKAMIHNIYSFIYSFHMPLFFTISGYVFYLTKSYKKYKTKVVDFTIVYVIWCFLTWLSKFLLSSKVNNPVELIDLLKIVYKPLMVYWYLYVLIIFYFIFSILRIEKPNLKMLYCCAFISVAVKFFTLNLGILNAAIYHMFFWILGGYMSSFNIAKTINNKTILSCLSILIVNITLYCSNISISPELIILKNIIVATASTIFLFGIFSKELYPLKNIFVLLGINTLQIYVVHCFITGGLRVAFKALSIGNVYLYFFLGTFLGIIIPVLLAKFCQTIPLFNIAFAPLNSIKRIKGITAS